jgi:hypothetical protein
MLKTAVFPEHTTEGVIILLTAGEPEVVMLSQNDELVPQDVDAVTQTSPETKLESILKSKVLVP